MEWIIRRPDRASTDSIALARVDANTFDATLKRAGKVVQTARNVVSADGKVMTVTVNGADVATGRTFRTVIVLEREKYPPSGGLRRTMSDAGDQRVAVRDAG